MKIRKDKAVPLQSLRVPGRLRFPDFKTIGTHEGGKVISHYAPAGLYTPGNIPGTHFC
jgi:hypothetical protein